MDDFTVGTRIQADGFRGTVKYIGEVETQKGTWLGVDWDSPERGKHDGTFNGKRYFITRYPLSGSFVRPNKVTKGVSFIEALKDRYTKLEENHIEEVHLKDLKKSFKAPFVEVVGMEKISNTQSDLLQLKEASVSTTFVSHAGEGIEEICPNLEEVDLSSTLVSSWDDVFSIIKHLPKLRILNVSYNVLQLVGPEETTFPSVRHLAINSVDYTWDDVLWVCKYFPALEYLQVCSNRIVEVSKIENYMQSVKRLDLENNSIQRWEKIEQLGKLQRLERLNLTRCCLENISVKAGEFPSLQILRLIKNSISSWDSVSSLSQIETLSELHILENPLLSKVNMETARQLVIARIGSLKILNGTEITAQERRGAEIDYLKSFASEWHKLSADPNKRLDFLEKHRRFETLLKKYGLPELEEVEKKPTTVKSSLIGIRIILPDSEPLVRKIPVTMQVSKLRSLVDRLKGGGDDNASLYVASQKVPDVLIPLDNEMRQLSFYSVEDGDAIYLK